MESIREGLLGKILGRGGCEPPVLISSAFGEKMTSGPVVRLARMMVRSTELLQLPKVNLFACHKRTLNGRGRTSRGECVVFA